ncbi:hypothetical protein P6141_001797 [Salmonella enterica]|nr:hypothetical protein [Salmonella enterica subsp. enterica serovar Monschaui]EKQ9065495.1 hypothetical protein [Salmonella enterica]
MPAPLVLFAPALYEAAVAVATAIGAAIGIIAVDEMVNEDEKTNTDSKVSTTDSTNRCKKCPAIPKVISEPEIFNGKKRNLDYQMRICGTFCMHNNNGTTTVTEFAFYDPRLMNPKKKVKFDGWKPEKCLFLEAKGEYDQFFEKDGEPWYSKANEPILQAGRQQNAIDLCDRIPECHWHFMQPLSYKYYKRELLLFSNITVFHTP